MPRFTCLDREAYFERASLLLDAAEADGTLKTMGHSFFYGQAADEVSRLPFSTMATKAANGDWEPAKELCRGELAKNGKEMAMDLWRAIEEAVAEAHAVDGGMRGAKPP